MAPDLEPAITLPWLVRLRWLFVAGLLTMMPVARWGFGLELSWGPLLLASGVGAISNLAIMAAVRRQRWAPAHVMGAAILVDIALLTGVLASSGGAMNPFTVFYLVYITLSAVVLSARWTTVIGVLAVAGFGVLFLLPGDPHAHHRMPQGLDSHLQGMWVAFVLAAILTAFFVRRVTSAIGVQRDQIAALREAAARHARLAAMTTLAAGAAHELNSPLGTIAVAAHEASLRLAASGDVVMVAEDLRLISLEVDRCQAILHQLAARSADASDVELVDVDAISARIRTSLGDELHPRVTIQVTGAPIALHVPSAQMVQSVVALIKNALDASARADGVRVGFARQGDELTIEIADQGAGIPHDVLAKVGDPFFTTKEPGAGMGLGVFLARLFFESRGGGLVIESEVGRGTRALIHLPLGSAPA